MSERLSMRIINPEIASLSHKFARTFVDSGIPTLNIQNEFEFNPESKSVMMKSKKNLVTNKEIEDENEKEKNRQKIYDNYELNNMDYYEASDLDERSCLRTYWSIIMREHYVIFTFCSRNDYNLFYIKIMLHSL